ncbi:MAG: hemolysin family protein [Lachnospiraceae bacterium]|nr:hemolysin family protein [Lachnospiraceae bacterium]MDD7078429.1 hemolysin family protein [Lachnospiraceae bacterium]MDY3729903.1 hemolysin family protein [Candidatus Choladocola sp.]
MDSDAGCLLGAVILFVLLWMDFIMTAFASAMRSVSDAELQSAFLELEKPPDEALALKDHFGKMTHTIWLLNTVTYIGSGFLAVQFKRICSPWLLLPILVILFYLIGNSIPEMLGHKHALRWITHRFHIAKTVLTLLSPITYIMTFLSGLCIRLFGIDPHTLGQEVTEDEIISMVNEGHEQGVLDAREAEMIQNIFELDDKKAEDIMTHRKNVIGISGRTNLRDAISFMVGETVSRFPVYDENIDNILGILHFKDAMKFHTLGTYDDWLIKDIPGLLREARFIPETRGINLLFRNMQAEKLQMVIVVDEYGQTAGLVAMEDILEEIVGNIQDEYDKDVQLIRKDANGCYMMDGMAPLEEVAELLEITLTDEDYDTLNGLLISKLDRIPDDGEQAEITAYGYLFQILKVENKIIRLVKITKSKEEEKE